MCLCVGMGTNARYNEDLDPAQDIILSPLTRTFCLPEPSRCAIISTEKTHPVFCAVPYGWTISYIVMSKEQDYTMMPVEVSRGVFKLSDSLYAINSKFLLHVYFFKTYSFILVRKKPFGLIIFDTGGPGSGELILNAVEMLGFSKKDIKAVAISHWHKDHTGGLAHLVKKIQPDEPIKIYMSEGDFPLFSSRMIRPIWFHPVLHVPIPHQSGQSPNKNMVRFIRLDSSGKESLLAEWGVEALSAPGHTPGHTAYFHRETGSMFAGCGISLMPGKTVCIVPIFWRRRKMIESAAFLSGFDFRYLYPVHFLLEANEIPRENRLPVKGIYSWLLRFFGFYPIFRYY
jgi:glyoxylase-like metal-dependent hydrolase (beta-lactamase superfamily II)